MSSTAFLFAALASFAAAQQPTATALRRALDASRAGNPGEPAFEAAVELLPSLISSGSGWFVAGGAYLAGRHGRTECVPALLTALARENQRSAEVDDASKRSILDALIRLDAAVPAALLTERLEESSVAETYLLLARDPDGARDGLLALFDAAPLDASARWAAACSLVEARDPRIAARLLAGMDWELRAIVRDAGSRASTFEGWNGGWSSAHETWPPKVTYELLLPEVEAPLAPIRHLRTEASRSGRMPKPVMTAQRAALKALLIDRLLGDVEERALLQPSEDLFIDWTGAEAYVNSVRTHCLGLRDRLARVALRLEAMGLLESAQECCASIQLRVQVKDRRESRTEPLPSLPLLPDVVYERE